MGVVGVGVVVVVILMDSRFNTTQDFLSFFFSFSVQSCANYLVVAYLAFLLHHLFFFLHSIEVVGNNYCSGRS